MIAALVCAAVIAGTPKLLVVDVDDLGAEFLRANRQPFFDLLDQHARSYARFYTAPVCSPTRAQMHYGVLGTHPDLLCPWLVYGDDPYYRTPTSGPLVPLGRAVTDAGLTAAKVGKWHLCPLAETTHPLDCGWSTYAGAMSNVSDFYAYPLDVDGVVQQVDDLYLTRLETDLGIAALLAGFDLVSVSYHAIHKPFHVPPADLFTAPEPTSDLGMARAMLEALARELDRLTAVAQQQGYHLILFADNGGVTELGGGKGSLREEGINTRMWCFGPGVVPGVDHSLVTAYDLYATVLDFFGIPRTPAHGPESTSFLATWQAAPGTRALVRQERFRKNGVDARYDSSDWRRVVIGPRYKYRVGVLQPAFFDLFVDPNESTNLLASSSAPPFPMDLLGDYQRFEFLWTGVVE